jgi:ABC-type sugar transport system permease subunit
MSFEVTNLDGTVAWSGFSNFLTLFKESRFAINFWNSIIYVIGNILLSTPLAYIVAILITTKLPQATYFRSIYLLPWVIAPIVSTLLFRSMVDPSMGPIAKLIEWISGEQIIILANPNWAMFIIIFHSFWRSFPFVMLFLSAGIASIPDEMYEAATIDGANSWKRFLTITFPLTLSHLKIALLMITMWTLHDAETITAFTRGGPGYSTETFAVRLFKSSFINFNLNFGSTIGVVLLIISLVFIFFYFRLVKEVNY